MRADWELGWRCVAGQTNKLAFLHGLSGDHLYINDLQMAVLRNVAITVINSDPSPSVTALFRIKNESVGFYTPFPGVIDNSSIGGRAHGCTSSIDAIFVLI